MKKFNGFDRNDVYNGSERLPVGGYVLKILDVKEIEQSWGNQLLFSFDIAEGEYKDFFAANYKAQQGEDKKWKGVYRLAVPKDDGSEQDAWTRRRFNTVIVNIEDSNPDYHWDWDERKLKGKKIGALFNNKEYSINGKHGFYTNCHSLVPVEKIKSGSYKIPEDTLLKNNSGNRQSAPANSDGFMNIPDGVDDELPF